MGVRSVRSRCRRSVASIRAALRASSLRALGRPADEIPGRQARGESTCHLLANGHRTGMRVSWPTARQSGLAGPRPPQRRPPPSALSPPANAACTRPGCGPNRTAGTAHVALIHAHARTMRSRARQLARACLVALGQLLVQLLDRVHVARDRHCNASCNRGQCGARTEAAAHRYRHARRSMTLLLALALLVHDAGHLAV